jgi:hypothetical protein
VRPPRIRTLRTAAGAVVLSAAAIAAGLFLRQSASGSGRSSLPASLPLAACGRPLVAAETIDFPPGL